jgi:hypothetical protein
VAGDLENNVFRDLVEALPVGTAVATEKIPDSAG